MLSEPSTIHSASGIASASARWMMRVAPNRAAYRAASASPNGPVRFNVNTQPLDLTVVNRNGTPFLHLTSTSYFEEITSSEFLATREA